MLADVLDVNTEGDPRNNGKDQRDEKHDPRRCFQSRHVAPHVKLHDFNARQSSANQGFSDRRWRTLDVYGVHGLTDEM
jgi:hypothetical protein